MSAYKPMHIDDFEVDSPNVKYTCVSLGPARPWASCSAFALGTPPSTGRSLGG